MAVAGYYESGPLNARTGSLGSLDQNLAANTDAAASRQGTGGDVLPAGLTLGAVPKTDFGVLKLGTAPLGYNGIPKRSLVYGTGNLSPMLSESNIVSLAGTGAQGSPLLGYAFSKNPVAAAGGFTLSPDMPLQFDGLASGGGFYPNSAPSDQGRLLGSEIVGSDQVAQKYGVTGKGVTVAIVDTGTDFSNPDVKGAVARGPDGVPIMLDADGQGLVLTKAKYIAKIDSNTGHLIDYYNATATKVKDLPANFTSFVYVNKTSGVFLRTSLGTIPVYNSLYPYYGTPLLNATANVDWKIGNSTSDYIRSVSGVYRFGVIFEAQSQLGQLTTLLVPVLVVDSQQSGVYDTIIPDMRAAWGFFATDVLASNPKTSKLVPKEIPADFTGQPKIRLGSGNEMLTYDYNHDGFPDFTAGMVGATVADVWQVIGKAKETSLDRDIGGIVHAGLLKPLDPNGDYFGVMFDAQGHGSSTAATVASTGLQSYTVYSNNTLYHLRGVAPDAKIIPVKALWAGDALLGWLYASGFDPEQGSGKWKYTGNHKADVVSNSWGISAFPLSNHGQGYDLLSIFSSMLTVPGLLSKGYPGTVFVISAGNDGVAYGSIGTPAGSPFAISVGATTNNVHVGSEGFANITRFGGSTQSFDNIADFSSRGPSVFGDPKPEIMAVGSYGFTPWIVTYQTVHSDASNSTKNDKAFSLFGGTSMAGPMVAGAAALLIQDMKNSSKSADGDVHVNPFTVKSLLMAGAKDLKNDPFVQGSGRVDALSSMELERGDSTGLFSLSTNSTELNISSQLSSALRSYSDTLSLIDGSGGLQSRLQSLGQNSESRWYAGQVPQGASSSGQITVSNPSRTEQISVELSPEVERLVEHKVFHNSTKLFQKDPIFSSKQYGFTPNYFNLTALVGAVPQDADLMVARVNFPFSEFMNSSNAFGDYLRIASVYAYDWNDKNHDGKVSFNETEMINRGGSWGTLQEMRIADPAHTFSHTPLIGVYPVPTIFSFWRGDRQINSTSMNFTLTIDFYKRQDYSDTIRFDTPITDQFAFVTVPPGESRSLGVTVFTKNDTLPGIYSAWIKGTELASGHSELLPVSYVVTTKPVTKDVPIVIAPHLVPSGDSNYEYTPSAVLDLNLTLPARSGLPSEPVHFAEPDGLRPNGYVGGPFDMISRYAAGDWRSYYFDVSDPTINNMALKVAWRSNYTSVNAMAFGPDGKLVASSVPSGVFSTFSGWASNDWLGTTTVSQGGGFYFSQNDGGNATVLNVPINGTGVYSVLLHNTLYSGYDILEPVSVLAKFSTIRQDASSPQISLQIPNFVSGASMTAHVTVSDDDPAGFYYSIDGGSGIFQNSTDQAIKIDTVRLSEGKHDLVIRAQDTVGHVSTLVNEFNIDRTPPMIALYLRYPDGSSVSIPQESPEKQSFIVPRGTVLGWNVTDESGIPTQNTIETPGMPRTASNQSGLMPVAWTISSPRPEASNRSAESLTFSEKMREYNVTIAAKDVAGNSASRSAAIIMDDRPPVLSLSVPSGDTQGNTTIGIKASDDLALSDLQLDIGAIKTVDVTGLDSYSLDTRQLADGTYTIKLVGTDKAGNSATATQELRVLNVQPLIVQAELLSVISGLAIASAVWGGLVMVKRSRRERVDPANKS